MLLDYSNIVIRCKCSTISFELSDIYKMILLFGLDFYVVQKYF